MWNTLYSKGLNVLVHLPDLFALRIALYDTQEHFLLRDMLWRKVDSDRPHLYRNIRAFGDHRTDGGFFRIVFGYLDFSFTVSCASEDGERMVCRIEPEQDPGDRYRFLIVPLFLWNRPGTVTVDDGVLHAESPTGAYTVLVSGCCDYSTPVFTDQSGILCHAHTPVTLLCNLPRGTDVSAQLAAAEAQTVAGLPKGTGFLQDIPRILSRAMNWNDLYDPLRDRICAPVARSWCTGNGRSFGSYVLFEWDTFLSALMCGVYSQHMAERQIYAVLAEQTPSGMIPNFGSDRGASLDRSQPPLGSYCVLKIYLQYRNRGLVKDAYPILLRWNRWWRSHRATGWQGLLSWGSDPGMGGYDPGGNKQAAMWESGLDNSPMYDRVSYNPATHTLELADVGLNALYALDCRCLAQLADLLEHAEDARELRAEYERTRTLMNREMYDRKTGAYCNLHANGKKSPILSPTCFYPLLAGIPSQAQAEETVRRHLLNPDEFWGPYVIPSIARNHPAFADQDYWRGRIWGPMNYLVYAGLRAYGMRTVATELAKKSRQLFMKEWKREQHIHENYNCITGDGDDRPNADAFYTWGALLAYLSVEEMFHIRLDGTPEYGGAGLPAGELCGFCFAGHRYRVRTGAHPGVWRDGVPLPVL